MVLGNEACDLDSMVSALALAYYLAKVSAALRLGSALELCFGWGGINGDGEGRGSLYARGDMGKLGW